LVRTFTGERHVADKSKIDRTASPDLSVRIGPLSLKNPVLVASGTFGYGGEYGRVYDVSRLGGIVTKSLSLKPREGNATPRIAETPSGMLNAIGLENCGLDRFLADRLPELRALGAPVIVNIVGHDADEFVRIAESLAAAGGMQAIELNLSCPNVSGGMDFSTDPARTAALVGTVRKAVKIPLIAKLSPNVTSIADIARAAESAGADAVSAINTFVGMAIDIDTRRPRLANVTGGLSGPAIRPAAVARVYQAARAVKIPVIGIGGIEKTADALEHLIAGATAVQVGTANFYRPSAPLEIIDGLANYLASHGFKSIMDVVGSIKIDSDNRAK
jgi:dihydroorotate dehydrogenase (NAD+) catalytic subunit